MKKELDDLLCQRYPLIFARRHDAIQESGMARGFACGNGWFNLIDMLCERLQFSTDHNHAPQVVALQVKEKFGELAFYVHGAGERQTGMVETACSMSAHICETCGLPGETLVSGATWLTRCPAHAPEGALLVADHLALLERHSVGRRQ